MRKLLLVFGTRPEAIKMAPIVLAARDATDFQPVVVVTGQHRAILDEVLETFGILPDHDLDILKSRQSLTHITTSVLERLEPVLEQERPDVVLVQGDTTTTFAAGLAAFYQRIPVVHVEAGLRSGDRWSPYPEELNRKLTTQIASLHLPPTQRAAQALLAEQVPAADIAITGNTVIDALHWVLQQGAAVPPDLDAFIGEHPLLLVTSHRRESWASGLASVATGIAAIAREFDDIRVVFPIHPNPVVREQMAPILDGLTNVLLVDPQPYPQFSALLQRATIVLTDSDGVQEEAPALGKPVLVTRENTERPEAVESGAARLIGTETDVVIRELRSLLTDPVAYASMANAVSPYGDGHAAERTLAALRYLLDGAPKPLDF